MKRLTDMTLPSGRKLRFHWQQGQFTCSLVSSISDNVLCAGKGANRLDALMACALRAYETQYRQDALHHIWYWRRLRIELYKLWKQVKPGIPQPEKRDVWGAVK